MAFDEAEEATCRLQKNRGAGEVVRRCGGQTLPSPSEEPNRILIHSQGVIPSASVPGQFSTSAKNLRLTTTPATSRSIMSERFIIALSDDLNAEIEAAAKASETSKSEILRKAIQL